jgi:CubicO group peptidase (beta-lactamase class C family)
MGEGLSLAATAMRIAPASGEMEGRLETVHRLLDNAVTERVTPGGILAVGWKGLVSTYPFGKLSYDADAAAVNSDTIYDIASLTKVVGTTTLIMQFVESGKLGLDAPLSRYLPEWLAAGKDRVWREKVTLRQLLTHSSGLPAYKEFFLEAENRAEIVKRVLATPLEYEPGTKSVYSDLGVILLGEVLTRISGRSLGELFRERIFLPLGMNATMFNPPKSLLKRIAPTEFDKKLRKRMVRGEVHDENTYVMGGESAHAGLFSTAGDLATFCQTMLNGGIYGHQRLVRRGTIEEFVRRQGPGDSTRALGWDTASPESSSGHFLSSRAYGHTGFTGTSLWIDPEKELFVILLTNRVHPTRENEAHRQLRPKVVDAVVAALGLKP